MRSDDDAVDTLRRAHRDASDRLDDVPDARVRAAVLAAAARGADARPRLVTSTPTAPAFRARRWPWSAAALLVVSVMTGLVATHVMRDGPERMTSTATIAGATTPTAVPKSAAPTAAPAAPAATTATTDASRANESSAATPREPPRRRPPVPSKLQRDQARSESPPDVGRAAAPVPAPPIQAALIAPPPAAASLAPAREARAKADAAADETSRDAESAPASESPRTATPTTLSATTAMRPRIGRTAEPATPEAWVARIVRLRADGHDAEADRELDGLRRRYPGFAIPADALAPSGTR